jgi:hypothetical protein
MLYREAWETGIWAWDHVHQEKVLVIPSVFALLGDNPMQSEMACHIGLMGKFFCRVCGVKGTDRTQVSSASAHADDNSNDSDGRNAGSGEDEDTGSSQATGSVKRVQETMEQIVSRVRNFVKVSCCQRFKN